MATCRDRMVTYVVFPIRSRFRVVLALTLAFRALRFDQGYPCEPELSQTRIAV